MNLKGDFKYKFDRESNPNSSLIEQEKESVIDTLKKTDSFSNFIIVVLLWTAIVFDYYLINLDAKSYVGGIYKNTLAIAVSSLTSCFLTRLILEFVSTKVFIPIFFFLAAIFSFFHTFAHESNLAVTLTSLTTFVAYSNYTTILYSQSEKFSP